MSAITPSTPEISVVVPTHNRRASLETLLRALIAQDDGAIRFDILVVDNGSTDETPDVVRRLIGEARPGLLRYLYEPRPGVSYARNLGAAESTAPIIAFLDDDGEPREGWVRGMVEAFARYPQADCVGGRLVPRWVTPRPSWLTSAHWGAVALQDRPAPLWLGRESASSCLLTANFACRREAFEEVGGFSPDYPRCQDREFEMRLWAAGRRGLFLPALDVTVEVPPERLTKRYHRRWHRTTGRYHALMRYRDVVDRDGRLVAESPNTRRFLGSPLFLYRDVLTHLGGWAGALLRGDGTRRFFHETRLFYLTSFLQTRLRTDLQPAWRRRRLPIVMAPPSADRPGTPS